MQILCLLALPSSTIKSVLLRGKCRIELNDAEPLFQRVITSLLILVKNTLYSQIKLARTRT